MALPAFFAAPWNAVRTIVACCFVASSRGFIFATAAFHVSFSLKASATSSGIQTPSTLTMRSLSSGLAAFVIVTEPSSLAVALYVGSLMSATASVTPFIVSAGVSSRACRSPLASFSSVAARATAPSFAPPFTRNAFFSASVSVPLPGTGTGVSSPMPTRRPFCLTRVAAIWRTVSWPSFQTCGSILAAKSLTASDAAVL